MSLDNIPTLGHADCHSDVNLKVNRPNPVPILGPRTPHSLFRIGSIYGYRLARESLALSSYIATTRFENAHTNEFLQINSDGFGNSEEVAFANGDAASMRGKSAYIRQVQCWVDRQKPVCWNMGTNQGTNQYPTEL